MNIFTKIWTKIKRKWTKIRLRPIRVFCFHHVSDEYDPLTMWECDWTSTSMFMQSIENLRRHGYVFISLQQAQSHLKNDWFRFKKYAVLTADDGYKSILNILSWLEEQRIPITLFVNTKYLDGQSWSEINEEQAKRAKQNVEMLSEVCPKLYLTIDEFKKVAATPNVTIGMHGHEHLDATQESIVVFKRNVQLCQNALKDIPHTIPYFAYSWGRHNEAADKVLKEMNLIPVLVNGTDNYNNPDIIDRKAIDGKQL